MLYFTTYSLIRLSYELLKKLSSNKIGLVELVNTEYFISPLFSAWNTVPIDPGIQVVICQRLNNIAGEVNVFAGVGNEDVRYVKSPLLQLYTATPDPAPRLCALKSCTIQPAASSCVSILSQASSSGAGMDEIYPFGVGRLGQVAWYGMSSPI